MYEREVIKQIKQLKKIQPDEKWVVFLRSEMLKKIEYSSILDSRSLIGVRDKSSIRVGDRLRENDSWAWNFFGLLRQPAIAVLSVLVILGVVGLVLVGIAQKSLPGDMVYPVKISVEQAQLKMVLDKTEKAKKEAEMTGKRAQELAQIIAEDNGNKEEDIKKAIEQIERQLAVTNENLPGLKEKAATEQEKVTEIAMAVRENAAKVGEAIEQAKASLSETLSEDRILATKISDISAIADKTNSQATEIIESIIIKTKTESNDNSNLPIKTDVPETQTSTPSVAE